MDNHSKKKQLEMGQALMAALDQVSSVISKGDQSVGKKEDQSVGKKWDRTYDSIVRNQLFAEFKGKNVSAHEQEQRRNELRQEIMQINDPKYADKKFTPGLMEAVIEKNNDNIDAHENKKEQKWRASCGADTANKKTGGNLISSIDNNKGKLDTVSQSVSDKSPDVNMEQTIKPK